MMKNLKNKSDNNLLLLSEVWDSSLDMMRITDSKGMIIDVNRSFCKFLELSKEELIGKKFNIIYNEKDGMRYWEEYKEFIKSRDKYTHKEMTLPYPKKKDDYFDVSYSKILIKKSVYVLCIFHNISERKKTINKIKKQADRINAIFSAMPDLFFVIDKNGVYKEFFSADTNKLALPREKIIGSNIKDVFGEKEGDKYIQLFRKCIETGQMQVFEYQLNINNKPMFFEARISPLDKDNIVSIIRDITENKLAEEAEKSLKNQLRSVLDTVPSYIFAKDYNGKFLMVNKSLADLFGVSPDEVIGKTDADYGATKEQINGYITADRKVIDSGKPLLIGEEQVLRADGSLGWFQTNKVPYNHPGCDEPAILGVAVDITERKEAEEKLKVNEIKYRNLYQSAEVALFDSSINEATILNCNKKFCELFGFNSPEEAIGQSVLQLYVNPEHRDVIRKIIEKSNYLNNYTVHFQNLKTERKFYGHLTMRIEEDGDKFVGSITDITNQMQTEQELLKAKEKAEEMSRLKTNFLANMSHEIRTPLNGILGFARMLEEELNDKELIEYANAISVSGQRLLETLDLILSFSKVEAEKEKFQITNICVDEVISEVIQSFDALVKNKNLYLKNVRKDKELYIKIDERILIQILNNLVNNAIKYTNEGGIIIETSIEENMMLIKVKDTGIGISRDKYNLIFEEFRQVSEGHSRSFEGTGLGLAISKRLIELMNGTIEVESEIGVGSTFKIKFPLIKLPKRTSVKIKKEKSEDKFQPIKTISKDKLSVLIVEDDKMNLAYTIKSIQEYFDVDVAVRGEDAIKKVKEKNFNIILMDINLGKGMSGMDTVRKIRKLSGYEKTPIIALTAFVLDGDREEFIEGGCSHYLGKPFTKNQILELLYKISGKIN